MGIRRIGSYNLVALLGLLSALTLLACVVVLTSHMDSGEATREGNLLSKRVDEDIRASMVSMHMWAKSDEAVRRLDHARDADWATSTFPSFSVTSIWTYTFDRRNQFISGQHESATDTEAVRQLEMTLPTRVAALRKLPYAASSLAIGMATQVDFFWANGTLYMVLLSPFKPASSDLRLQHSVAPALVAVAPYNDFVRMHLAGMGLEGINVARQRSNAEAKPVKDVRGHTVAWINWKVGRPGADLLRVILWPMMALSFAFVALLVVAHMKSLSGQRRLMESEARANYMAFHDQLTDLANRRCLVDALNRAVEKATRDRCELALLLIDLDRFKLVNDTYGHQCGDELIKEAARRLKLLCRNSNDLCARLGGDEFVILAPDCSTTDAEKLAKCALDSLSRPVMLSAATIQVAGSIGVALFDTLSNSETLLRDADLALYCAKNKGRNAFCLSTNVAPLSSL